MIGLLQTGRFARLLAAAASAIATTLAVSAQAAVAQQADSPPTNSTIVATISEAEFLSTLGPSHPAVVALTAQLASAEAERKRAGTLANPTVEFEHEAPFEQADQTTIKLGWQPPLDGRRKAAINASDAAVEAAQKHLEWAQLHLRERFRGIYADWALAAQRRDRVERFFGELEQLERRLTARAERGEESLLAARRFALAVSQVRGELASAEADLARARGIAISARGDLPSEVTPTVPPLPPVPASLDESVRPDVLARRDDVETAQLRRKLAGQSFQFPTLIFGWTQISAANRKFDGPWVGLTWEMPLFDRNQGDQEEFSRAVAIEQARLRLTEREAAQLRLSVADAYSSLHAALLEVEATVEAAPDVAAAASAAFLAGESSMTDLLETLRSVLASQLAALDLRAQALAAHRELELSAGHSLTEGDS